MRYYIIAGEASGDLHASHLIAALREHDPQAVFRGFGGNYMEAQGMELVRHYSDLAYMGFIQVALHARTILNGLSQCKSDIKEWQPDVLILVDYPGFNLRIAKDIHLAALCPVYYYISPKIWAWKEGRIKAIRRDIDEMFSILPFEVDFYEKKHHYPIHYVGNPTLDEVSHFRAFHNMSYTEFCNIHHLSDTRPIIALLPGSRKQEVKDNLPSMLDAVSRYSKDYNIVLAATSSLNSTDIYKTILTAHNVEGLLTLTDNTFELLSHSSTALVTSGTATLETAIFNVPQVVCYNTRAGRFVNWARRHFLNVPFISLVNLIAGKEVVPELIGNNNMNAQTLQSWLEKLLPGGAERDNMLAGYRMMMNKLGSPGAPERAAQIMLTLLNK
ncbi:MAG: lipid-A-disaccharide synthase [Bacteroidaceae bacterium]|nr:lipid-A-disaccharide synthase [Bacteroidaceae bacterium]